MLTSSLPPRGVFVPTSVLFHSQLPSAVLLTWIQLRALAWKGWSTPAMTLPEFASILGIHPSRLQKHLDHLQSASLLTLRATPDDKLVISFPEQPLPSNDERSKPGIRPSHSFFHTSALAATAPAPESGILPLASYFPHQILGYLTYDENSPQPEQSGPSAPLLAERDKSMIGINRIDSLCSQEIA